MKKILAIIFILVVVFGNCMAGESKAIYYHVQDEAGIELDFSQEPYDNIVFKAWIVERPTEIITNETVGCGYEMIDPFSSVYINIGNFASPWSIGETLCILVEDELTEYCDERTIIIPDNEPTTLVGFEPDVPDTGNPLILWSCKGDIDENGFTPNSTKLKQNYPNPFNPTTTIEFDIEKKGMVSLNIYNQEGKIVRNAVDNFMKAGKHSVGVDLSNVSAGTYYYILKVDGVSEAKKMVLVK